MPAAFSSHENAKRLLPLWEGRAMLIGSGVVLTLCVALLLIFQPLIVRQAELRIYDLMRSGRISPPKSSVPVLVGIDEESLNSYGQWPWPRYRMARLVERLSEFGAKVIALDVLMPEPDRTSPEVIVSERQRDREPAAAFAATEIHDSNSLRLARAISAAETVLGFFLDFTGSRASQPDDDPVIPEGMIVTQSAGSAAGFPEASGVIRSIRILTEATRAEGFTNAIPDCDGALRRLPLLLPYEGKLYPSLSVSALLLSTSERELRLTSEKGERRIEWGKRWIPLDGEGNLLLDFRDENMSFPYLSARSVLDGEISPGSLKGKIVLVGAWAKGLGDYHLVPSGRSLNGLTLHGTVIDNILSGSLITRPGWARGAELFAVFLLGIVTSWLLSRSGFALSLATVLLGSFLCYWGGRELLVAGGLYLSPLMPMLTPVVVMTFLSLLKYGIEARKVRQRTRALIDAQDTIIVGMSALAETRDKETGAHIVRTRRYVEILARQMAIRPGCNGLEEISIELLTKSAPLHDIGKVGIPDHILHKQGELSETEYEIMKRHTLIGAEALTKTIRASSHPESHAFLDYAQGMIESHHERWDGSGYPHGLKGEEIPLAGRLMALADVYDAMISRRAYKKGLSHKEAREFILQNSGKQFDPDVVEAFIATNEEFARVAREFADET
jgi:adenylate cyclase